MGVLCEFSGGGVGRGGGGGVEDGLREKRGIGLKGSEKLVRE